jgi:hypothetical protein
VDVLFLTCVAWFDSLDMQDYNDWVIGVMEDEGYLSDHTSGLSATGN